MTTELIRDPQSSTGPEPPDPALFQAIRPSASRMAAAEELFVQLLHEDIGAFLQHLPDRGRAFCERTARTVLWLVLSDQSADAVIQALYWLGAANQADGFPPSEYVTVGHALVRTAREMSGTHWTTTTGSAWIRFFMWLQPYLQADTRQQVGRQQESHQEAAPEQAADPGASSSAFDQARRPTVEEEICVVADLRDSEEQPWPRPGD
jgi:hypothetical protein